MGILYNSLHGDYRCPYCGNELDLFNSFSTVGCECRICHFKAEENYITGETIETKPSEEWIKKKEEQEKKEAKRVENITICKCGHELYKEWHLCPWCGTKIKDV